MWQSFFFQKSERDRVYMNLQLNETIKMKSLQLPPEFITQRNRK